LTERTLSHLSGEASDKRTASRYASRLFIMIKVQDKMQIEANRYVTLKCELKNDKGERLDEGDEPIEYVHGYSTLVPGLEAGLVGLQTGDQKEIVVPANLGFGEIDDELVMEIDRGEFPEQIAAGDEFIAESEEGEEVTMRVVEVRDDAVIVDANHPFAGQTLHYQVKVEDVREATDEEIAEAATAYEEGEGHVHDESCGHDHSHDGHDHSHSHDHGSGVKTDLVQLGTKKKQIVLN
jgi:FKBP-type peptidyl-prolyl cis-trans isomerase SlyD